MKYLKTFEGYGEDLTYDQALKLGKYDNEIKQYVEDNYPEHGYNAIHHYPIKNGKYQTDKKYITYGKSIGVGQAKKLLALAKRKNDLKLFNLLTKRTKNIEEVELDMKASKYNL